jgi:hypothetical protein
MRRNAEGFETATELAEAANAALRLPPEAMDDEGHWVWEEALSALEWVAPNAKVRGPEAASSPEAPSRLPGSAAADQLGGGLQ